MSVSLSFYREEQLKHFSKDLYLCSTKEIKSYEFGTTQRLKDDQIFIFLVIYSFYILHSAAVIGSHRVSWVICFSLVMFALQSKPPLLLEQKSHWTTTENSLWQSENKWIRHREFHRTVVIWSVCLKRVFQTAQIW